MDERFQYLTGHPESLLVFNAFAFITTFLAQLGNHSKIHERIARIALPLELGTLGIAALSFVAKTSFPEIDQQLDLLALVGSGLVSLCYLAVPLTDERYHNHFASGKGLNRSDLSELVGILKSDFVRHMTWGSKELIKSASRLCYRFSQLPPGIIE